MDEQEFRSTLSKEELEKRGLILPFKITDVDIFERLNRYSAEFSKTYDQLINTALVRFFDDIETANRLRR